ncbi:MAG: hypothetical protein [Bacteriophage sp.]|jgi:type IV secretory pathway TrbD component|uniref:hypothetical protein n=2 Tax=Bacteroides TaxID=816 RepID=UPI000E74FC6B|nr:MULTISPECIES: hypothetical protein [Bacteroides]MBO1694171.1 hypothetical protein [Bacteroides uniformis]RJU15851.1 hypothetical protein DW039_06585 [Bacteroides sp. AF39-16AC]RJU41013.1 hypothetical protein DW800_17140 [Bacteroides sp. AM32-11AC]UWH95754.1 MAG: hypothetical protein [Bacteriophage sp.]
MKDNTSEKILEIRVKYDDAIRKIAEYRTQLDILRKVEQTLKEDLKKGRMSREEYNIKLTENRVATQQYTDAIRVLNKQIQNERKEQTEMEGSLVRLRAELSNLTAAYDRLSRVEREGGEGKELQDKINAITDELKGAEEETQRFYRNVGNYKDAILQATEAQVPFVSILRSGVSVLRGTKEFVGGLKDELVKITVQYKAGTVTANMFSGAQKTAAITSNLLSAALKVLKLALISTGIGAIVVLLGSLVAWLAKTQKGTEFLSNVMSSFGAIIDVIIDRIAKFGGAIAKFFSGDFSGAAKDMKDSFSGIGKEISNDAKQAWALNDALQQLEKSETMLNMKRAASRSEIERLKLIADDTTKSLKERTDAATKAYDMENKLQQESIDIGRKKLANLLGQIELTGEANKLLDDMAQGAVTADEVISRLGISESTVKDLKEFSQVFSDVAQKEMESYTRNKETQNKINAMRKESVDKAKVVKEKELSEIRKAEDEMLKLVKDSREKQSIEIERQFSRQIEDLRVRLIEEQDLTTKARGAINNQIIALEQQKNDALQQLSEEQLMKEVENRQKLISLQLESVKAGGEQEYQLKMQQLVAQRDVELRQKELTEQMKLAITEKYNKEIYDLSVQHENDTAKKQADALKLRLDNELAEAKLNGDSELELLRMQEQQKLELKDSLRRMGEESDAEFRARQLAADQEYLNAKQAVIDKEVEMQQNKGESLSVLAGNLSDLLEQAAGDNENMAQLAKILAIAEVSIAQGVAIAKAVETATRSSATWIDMLAAIGTVVASVTTVMGKAMKSVKSAKFAQGGKVEGPGSGTSDSIPAMLSNGESVMTAAATSMFAPLLSAFNQIGGGIPINVTASSNQALGEDMLAKAVAKGMMMAPAPVVSVEEFTSVANRVKYVENLGSI